MSTFRRIRQLSESVFGLTITERILRTWRRMSAPFRWAGTLETPAPEIPDFDVRKICNASMDKEITAQLEALLSEVKQAVPTYFSSVPWVLDYYTNALPRMNATIGLARHWYGKRGLDVGIAFGFLDLILRDIYSLEIMGTELEENIPLYCQWAISKGIKIHPWRLGREPAPYASASQDFIIFAEVLEHLKKPPNRVLDLLCDLLKPGGQLLLTTPNLASYENIRKMIHGENILERFRDDLPIEEDPTDYLMHVREYTIGEIISLVRSAGLVVDEVTMCNWGKPHFVPRPYLNEIICLVATKLTGN